MHPDDLSAPRPRLGSAWHRRTGAAVAALIAAGLAAAAAPAAPIDFSREVLPILSEHCFTCHGPDAKTRKANLRLDRKEGVFRPKDPLIVPGKSGESDLIARVTSTDPEEVMPPRKGGRPLTPAQVDVLRRWVDEGAKWGKHWAFETPVRPPLPPVHDAAWSRNPIDRFVLARLEAEGLRPSPEADRTTLIRRTTLDLTGLPPSPAEVDSFLADRSADACTRLVERLLASPHYGERMASDWLDQARYADTNGYQNDFARTMWPWRDWVIDAFNANQPFDRFVVEQIAGDLLPGATLRQKVATGFNRNNRTVTEAGSIDEEWRIENAVDHLSFWARSNLEFAGRENCEAISARTMFRCDIRSMWIDPAGPFGNLLGGTLALIFVPFVPRRSAGVRLLLIFVAGFAFFWEAGHLISAMGRRHGDLYFAGQDFLGEPSLWWRITGAVAGIGLYVFSARWASRALSDLWPDAAVARRVARTAWVTASIGAILAALVYSGEGWANLRDAALEIGAAACPWLLIPRQRRAQVDAVAPVRIERSRTIIAVSLVVFAIFVATLGRGVRF